MKSPMCFLWFFCERLTNKIAKFFVLSYVLAWLLSCTSTHLYLNLPLAAFLVFGVHYLSTHLVFPTSLYEKETHRHRRSNKSQQSNSTRGVSYVEKPKQPPNTDSWKRLVNAPIVESAWESFCGGIIQEWIYDSWYSIISPDREFPAEVRRLLNEVFGEVCQRAKRVDIRTLLLRDMCDLFTEQLELYRSTKSTVGILNEQHIRLASKDRAFQQEMKTNRTLHAAFYSRDGHYRMIRRMSEGVVSVVLEKEVVESPGLKSLIREILSSCVLRQVVLFFTPYNANKWLLSILNPTEYAKMTKVKGGESIDAGCFEFDQRVRASVMMEEKDRQQQESRKKNKSRLIISKSHPNLASRDLMQEAMEDPPLSTHSSTSNISEMMEETDLLRDESVEGMDSSVDTPTGVFNRQVCIEDISFIGQPSAKVVAPEINTSNGREYVVFKIRVADKTGEWTVTRRYRNFEALHRLLRDVPAYRELNPKLPPKRIFLPTHKTEVVEQRRLALDKYLQAILSSEHLAARRDVWLFLSDQGCRSFKPDVNVGLVKLIADNVDNARYTLKRKVADSFRSQSRFESKEVNALCELGDSDDSSPPGSIKQEEESTNHQASAMEISPPLFKSREQETGLMTTPENDKSFSLLTDQQPSNKTPKKNRKFQSANENKVSGKLSHSNLLSRFDYQERDALDRQVEKAFHQIKKTSSWSLLAQEQSMEATPEGGVSSSESDYEDYSGISAPLYEVADAIFNFPAQNLFRRQVLQVMRQILSLLAGDAIDVYLNEKIKGLRSEYTIAWLIHCLKGFLWPNGVWFSSLANETTREETSQSTVLKATSFLDGNCEEKDANEVAELLRARLFRRAPAALVQLIGKSSYMQGMKDVYDMIQLPTFVRQLGYGVLEIGLLALFPELKDLFEKIHLEGRNMP